MGVTFDTICLDCGAGAPGVGDFGYIGYPSSSRERGPGGEQPPNFGYLYAGFEAILLITWDLDALDSFLRAHEGHRLHTFGDGEPAFGDGGNEIEDPGAFGDFDMDEDPDENWSEETAAIYPVAHYHLQCRSCEASFQAEFADNIKVFEPATLSADAIERFLEHVGNELDSEAFYRAGPLSPDDLLAVVDFLSKHQSHSPEASIVREEP